MGQYFNAVLLKMRHTVTKEPIIGAISPRDLIKNNLPTLIGKEIYVCDLDFILTEKIEVGDDLDEILECLNEILNPIPIINNNWDNKVLITEEVVGEILLNIQQNIKI